MMDLSEHNPIISQGSSVYTWTSHLLTFIHSLCHPSEFFFLRKSFELPSAFSTILYSLQSFSVSSFFLSCQTCFFLSYTWYMLAGWSSAYIFTAHYKASLLFDIFYQNNPPSCSIFPQYLRQRYLHPNSFTVNLMVHSIAMSSFLASELYFQIYVITGIAKFCIVSMITPFPI